MAMMIDERMERIEKMLRAQLKSTGHVWWIGGYVYGVTSNDSPFIILYPSAENLKEKVVRVYDHDFKKLPGFIPTDVGGGDTEANPSKEQARKKGIYHECPAFEICTYDGKDTQMGKERRFGDVLRLSRAAAEAVRGVGAPTSPAERNQPPQRATRPSQPPPPPPSPPVDDSAAGRVQMDGLPDYEAMALDAQTFNAFDYAAFMVLKNGLYTEVEHISKTRESLIPAWRPGARSSGAMLEALRVYRDKRVAAEGRGEATAAAHAFAKKEARRTYNKAIG